MLYSMNSCTGWIFVHISAFGVGGWVEVGKKQVLGALQLLKDFQKHKTLKLSISLENIACRCIIKAVEWRVGWAQLVT